MANLTLTIDDEILKRARLHAIERGTSVNALVREYLEGIVQSTSELESIIEGIDSVADAAPARRATRWKREDLYAERLRRR
jgi:hypothetical protein